MSPSFQPSHDWTAVYAEFVVAKRLLGRAPRTLGRYNERVYPFVRWLGAQPITRTTIRVYLSTLPTTYAPATLHGHVRDISAFCAWLVEEHILDTNPCRGLAPKLPKHLPAHYTHDQLAALLRVCDMRDRAIVLAFLDTGLRLAEFVQLRRDRVDWRSGHFTVIGKDNVERPGWFSIATLFAIRAYLDQRDDHDGALWYGRYGPLTRSGVYQIIKRRVLEAGIRDDVRRLVHGFRSSFGKLYLESGGDLESLRQLYGHATLQMTSYYAQLAFEPLRRKRAAVNTVAQFINE